MVLMRGPVEVGVARFIGGRKEADMVGAV